MSTNILPQANNLSGAGAIKTMPNLQVSPQAHIPAPQPSFQMDNPLTIPKADAKAAPAMQQAKVTPEMIQGWVNHGSTYNEIYNSALALDPEFQRNVDYQKSQFTPEDSSFWDTDFPKIAVSRQYLNGKNLPPIDPVIAGLQRINKEQTKAPPGGFMGMINSPGDLMAGGAEQLAGGVAGMLGMKGASDTLNNLPEAQGQTMMQNAGTVRDNLPMYASAVAAPFTGGMSMMGGAALVGGASAAGEAVNQGLQDATGTNRNTPIQQAESIGTQGLLGAGSQVAGNLVGKGLSYIGGKLAAPFASSFNPEVAQLADKYGIQLPASAMTDSKVIPQVEAIEGKSLFGGGISNMVDKAQGQLDQVGREAAGISSDKPLLGSNIIQGFKDFKNSFNQTKNGLYDIAEQEMKNADINNPPDLKPVTDYLSKVVDSKKLASVALPNVDGGDTLTAIRNNLDQISRMNPNSKDTVGILRSTITELNNKIDSMGGFQLANKDPLTKTYEAVSAKLQDSLDNYLTTELGADHPAIRALAQAKDFYKEGINKINSTFGDVIDKNIQEPSHLVDSLIKPNRPDLIPQMFDTIGPQNTADLRSHFMNSALNAATNNGVDPISGAKLSGFMKKYGEDTVKTVLNPEQYKSLSEIRTLASAIDKGQAVSKGSQTAFLSKISVLGATMFMHPIMLAKVLLGDAALSKVLTSPTGIKWLTEGFQPIMSDSVKPVSEALGGVGKAALQKRATQLLPNSTNSTPPSLHQLNPL